VAECDREEDGCEDQHDHYDRQDPLHHANDWVPVPCRRGSVQLDSHQSPPGSELSEGLGVGVSVGSGVAVSLGSGVGVSLGSGVGVSEGSAVGESLGLADGVGVGDELGSAKAPWLSSTPRTEFSARSGLELSFCQQDPPPETSTCQYQPDWQVGVGEALGVVEEAVIDDALELNSE
jgi:hypothetical protein